MNNWSAWHVWSLAHVSKCTAKTLKDNLVKTEAHWRIQEARHSLWVAVVCVNVCVLHRVCVVSGWLRQCVGPSSLQCAQLLRSSVGWVEASYVWGTPRRTAPLLQKEPEQSERATEEDRRCKVDSAEGCESISQKEIRGRKRTSIRAYIFFYHLWYLDLLHQPGYAMLTQRNGLPPGCKEAPLKDPSDLWDVDVSAEGCCSLSSSLSSGGCPWARLADVDGCLSEPYCLWFQLLARTYWGEVELGLNSTNRSVSWARLREASRKSFLRSRVKH